MTKWDCTIRSTESRWVWQVKGTPLGMNAIFSNKTLINIKPTIIPHWTNSTFRTLILWNFHTFLPLTSMLLGTLIEYIPLPWYTFVSDPTLRVCQKSGLSCLGPQDGWSVWKRLVSNWRYIHITIYHKNYIISEVKNIRMIFFPEFHEFRLYDVKVCTK